MSQLLFICGRLSNVEGVVSAECSDGQIRVFATDFSHPDASTTVAAADIGDVMVCSSYGSSELFGVDFTHSFASTRTRQSSLHSLKRFAGEGWNERW